MRPLGDRVVVREHNAETETSFGLIIPDVAQEKPCIGEVVARGQGMRAGEVSVGDTVLYAKWGGQAVKWEGEEVLIIEAKDIYAVMS